MPEGRWSIVVHGGAKEIENSERQDHLDGCTAAAEAGAAVLRAGGTAVDAVVAAIRCLEENPTFNAGTGSVRNRVGDIENDAGLMDGATLDIGAVAGLKGALHPISVAYELLREDPILLAGEGAAEFAKRVGAEPALTQPPEAVTPASDTVGCVAFDQAGDCAAGTSTGGLEGQAPGRVGDSPLPGCGFFAEDGLGAVSLSGDGENIARLAIASVAMHELGHGNAQQAADAAIRRLATVQGEGGIIVLDSNQRFGWAHNSRDFAVAHIGSEAQLEAFTRR
jgi:beta-aspartyl-peptidase (threonine type)